jgi:hypothetical protein
MIDNFNDGRSRSFFCKAACLLDIKVLKNFLVEANKKIKTDNIGSIEIKAKILKDVLSKYFSDHL